MFDTFMTLFFGNTTNFTLPLWLDLSAVMVGAVSGVLVAQEKNLDLVGFCALSVMGGLGGGLVRDTIMQQGGVYALDSAFAIPSVVVVALVGFVFPRAYSKHPHALEWVDIISIGLFAAAGTDKALTYALSPWASVLMGVLTAVGGGMVRDICTGTTPKIFKQSNYYALCAIAGCVAHYIGVCAFGASRVVGAWLCVGVIVVLRRLSLHYGWKSPVPKKK